MVLVQTPAPPQALLSGLKDAVGTRADVKLQDDVTDKPLVFMDVAIDGMPLGRVVIELDMARAPMTCANFLALCTGSHKDKIGKCTWWVWATVPPAGPAVTYLHFRPAITLQRKNLPSNRAENVSVRW